MMPSIRSTAKTQLGAMVDETRPARHGLTRAARKSAKLRWAQQSISQCRQLQSRPTVVRRRRQQNKIAQEKSSARSLSVSPVKVRPPRRYVPHTIYGLPRDLPPRTSTKLQFAKGLRAGSVWVNTYDAATSPRGSAVYKSVVIGRDKSLHACRQVSPSQDTGSLG